jgi:hypothetical protein
MWRRWWSVLRDCREGSDGCVIGADGLLVTGCKDTRLVSRSSWYTTFRVRYII